jgi:hypothetical protein
MENRVAWNHHASSVELWSSYALRTNIHGIEMVLTSIDVPCLQVQASTARRTNVAAWEAELGRDTGRMVKVVPNRSVLREI